MLHRCKRYHQLRFNLISCQNFVGNLWIFLPVYLTEKCDSICEKESFEFLQVILSLSHTFYLVWLFIYTFLTVEDCWTALSRTNVQQISWLFVQNDRFLQRELWRNRKSMLHYIISNDFLYEGIIFICLFPNFSTSCMQLQSLFAAPSFSKRHILSLTS